MQSASPKIEEGLYPMRVVTRLTGLTADTIRVWERRYGAVVPRRTEGNARRFHAEDVRRLLLMREARARGHSIQSIATLSENELEALLSGTNELAPAAAPGGETDSPHARIRERYLAEIARFEVRRAGELLARAASLFGPVEFALEVLVPLLQEVGERWSHADFNVAQEHLVTQQVRSLLFTVMRFVSPQPGARRILLAAPEGHLHEFGLLVTALLAASQGHEPVLLGPNLPANDLHAAVELSKARLVVLSIVRDMTDDELRRFRRDIEALPEGCEVWLGCPPGHPAADDHPRLRVFHDFETVNVALTDL